MTEEANKDLRSALLRANSLPPPEHLVVVRPRQEEEGLLAKSPEEKLGSVVVKNNTTTVERSGDESSREEASESQTSSSNVPIPSEKEAPHRDKQADAEVKVEINPNSAHISLAEMVELSAVFAEDAHSIGAKFLKMLERDKSLKVAKKDEYGELVCPLLDYVTKQYSWLCLLHGKASQTGDQPVVCREVGVGNTPYSSRNFSRLSLGSRNGVGPKLSDNEEGPESRRTFVE